jgi:ribosomal protein L6P/L9E
LAAETRRVTGIFACNTHTYSRSLSFLGSGFRIRYVKDTTFQHGVSLELQLGSKDATVRVPFTSVSVSITEGR